MSKYIFLFSIVYVIFFSTSCKRKTTGGLGGNAILKIYPKHHNLSIDSCTVYIKFNSSELPTNGVYDMEEKVVKVGSESYATLSGLKKGYYYIYGYGWDPSISENVKGGIPYRIKEETEISITLPVTEAH